MAGMRRVPERPRWATALGRQLWEADRGPLPPALVVLRRPAGAAVVLLGAGLLLLGPLSSTINRLQFLYPDLLWLGPVFAAFVLLLLGLYRPFVAWIATAAMLTVDVATAGLLPATGWSITEWQRPLLPLVDEFHLLVLVWLLLLVAAVRPLATAMLAGVVTLGIVIAAPFTRAFPETYHPLVGAAGVMVLLVLGTMWRRQGEHRRGLAQAQEKALLLRERASLARELHDVVAHDISLLAVRAETAPYRLSDVPSGAKKEFLALASDSRDTLQEMRRLLTVLRSDRDPPTTPEPGLTDLPELVSHARATGVDVTLDVSADLSEIPGTVGLCAYRIAQEAITNATRHAPGAAVTVALIRQSDRLEVRVHNASAGQRCLDVTGSRSGGHGIRGMRERAEAIGGELTAGPNPAGGFQVLAVLPLRVPAQ